VELLVALALIAVVGLLGPLVAWYSDEHKGRSNWIRVLRATETFSLGVGAFRGTSVEVHRDEVLRDRAPWWVRLLALTCYLPVGAALLSGLPWLVGVLFLFDRNASTWGFDLYANALLVAVYPFGCWAAARMSSLGSALMSGDPDHLRASLASASWVVVPLNAAILVGSFALSLRFRSADAGLLAVAPVLTLMQLTAVATAGLRQVHACARMARKNPPARGGASVISTQAP